MDDNEIRIKTKTGTYQSDSHDTNSGTVFRCSPVCFNKWLNNENRERETNE